MVLSVVSIFLNSTGIGC